MKKVCPFIIFAVSFFNVSAQLKVGDQPTISEKSVALDVKGSNGQQGLWLPRVSDTSVTGIRALNPPDGLIIYHSPSGGVFFRSNNTWKKYIHSCILNVTAAANTMTGPALTHNTGNAGTNFNISSSANTATWNLRSASTTSRGTVNNTLQFFIGNKTFNDSLVALNGSTLSLGTLANGGVTVTGAATNQSSLYLGITSGTTPGTETNKFLTVDATGKVVLDSLNGSIVRHFNNIVMNGANLTVAAGASQIVTFTITGANLSTNSTVIASPTRALGTTTSLGWVKVTNATTITMGVCAKGASQTFSSANTARFNFTVIEH